MAEPDAPARPRQWPVPALDSQPGVAVRPGTVAWLRISSWPWRAGAAALSALLAQRALEPPDRSLAIGVSFYLISAVFLVLALRQGEWSLAEGQAAAARRIPWLGVRLQPLVASLAFGGLAFLAFAGNRFTPLNLTLWGLSLAFLLAALWEGRLLPAGWRGQLLAAVRRPTWNLTVKRSTVAFLAVAGLAIFFRFYQLDQVPPEMFSDHAEKLLDVGDVLRGETHIFFPRNTGREAVQMYLTAAIAKYFGTGLSFLSMKIGTALAGLVALPFIYLLGKEVGNRQVGLLAMAFAGIAYWPNVISRVALRFSLYPLFAAPALYFLFRGLQTGRRNQLLLSGLFLGLGLHGYSPFRFVPLVVVAIVAVFLLHARSREERLAVVGGLAALALVSFAVFLPLFRYSLDEPEMFFLRTFTRIGSTERPMEAPLQVFLKNTWDAIVMPFWSNGGTWVHSVVFRPALDVVSAALYGLGSIFLLVRYLQRRDWTDLALLISVPLLMMPSILSLAFPDENPSLNRTAGALIPVFVIVGLALESLLRGLRQRFGQPAGGALALGVGALLLAWSASNNYDLVFNQYFRQFQQGAWNTSEIGQIIRAYADSVGEPDSAWVVPNPHWVDTRLVGINAGFPEKDYALWPEDLERSLEVPSPKLFIVRPGDENGLNTLTGLYPTGRLWTYHSRVESKDFLMYFVP